MFHVPLENQRAMNALPKTEETLLIRTDFSDEAAWQALRTAVTTPADQDDDDDDDDDDDFLAVLHIVDDPSYRGLTAEQLAALAPEGDDLLVVADSRALTDPEMPLLALYLDEEEAGADHAELRVVASELWSVENNISLANMDWTEFVDAAATDGVFRGF
ncbi:DUF6924 domain-containing protein [Streptomyces sp. CRN 30]|uniref:DUF6924 domain-containing protein n=1 Tax=Streptomyces sp. CRN 30 TaxID=3075613 RepID=UPI002A819876|nr:hypothetical protein [Streptomyces sp. CRN 30]